MGGRDGGGGGSGGHYGEKKEGGEEEKEEGEKGKKEERKRRALSDRSGRKKLYFLHRVERKTVQDGNARGGIRVGLWWRGVVSPCVERVECIRVCV